MLKIDPETSGTNAAECGRAGNSVGPGLAGATLLVVDDEPNILNALKRLLADCDCTVLTASNAVEGLDLVQSHPIDAVISDYCMPGPTGVEFLAQVKIVSPATERILMTAYATLDTAIQAINRGEIFRFIVKPWDNQALLEAIEDSLMHRRLVNTLTKGEETMYLTMARMVELKDPYTRNHCRRVAEYALAIGEQLGLNAAVMKELRWGSWLHDCGKVGVPEHVLNYPGKLSSEDFEYIRRHPEWGASVVSQAGLSRQVINIVLYHHEHYSGKGYPFGLRGEHIPLEARIVAVADVFDALSTDRPYRSGYTEARVREIMKSMGGVELDPHLVDLLLDRVDLRMIDNDTSAGHPSVLTSPPLDSQGAEETESHR